MSTMLSDKVEQVGGAVGGSPDIPAVEVNPLGSTPVSDLRAELKRWKDEVLAAIHDDKTWGGSGSLGGGNTREALAGVTTAVKSDAHELVHQVEDYVIEHPIKSLCIAAGVGFLLGVMWS